jgi:hypothetical protein
VISGAEMWESEEGWKETDVTVRGFCKKLLMINRFSANGVAELELGQQWEG